MKNKLMNNFYSNRCSLLKLFKNIENSYVFCISKFFGCIIIAHKCLSSISYFTLVYSSVQVRFVLKTSFLIGTNYSRRVCCGHCRLFKKKKNCVKEIKILYLFI